MVTSRKVSIDKSNNPKSMTPSINAYNSEEFQTFVFDKTEQFKDQVQDYIHKNLTVSKIAGLSFVASPSKESIPVVDLGGGAGIDFFIHREIFKANKKWICLETEAMCKVMMDKFTEEEYLQFDTLTNFLEQTNQIDFSLYSNSALQYLNDPINVLNSLLGMRPKRVAIIRTPFVIKGGEFSDLQKSNFSKNGPQVQETSLAQKVVANSIKFASLGSVKELFQQHNYQIWCENMQAGSFTTRSRLLKLKKSQVKTVDLLAERID